MDTAETVLSKGYVGLVLSFEQADNKRNMKTAGNFKRTFAN